jgi:hypothetical protein
LHYLALNTCMLGNATFSLIARFDGIALALVG